MSTANHSSLIAVRKHAAARLAVASDLTLLILKVVTAIATGSVAVLAEVVNSAGDLVGALIVFLAVRAAGEPPDATHEYGHGKIENLSGIATATLVATGGLYAGYEAVRHIIHPVVLPHLRSGVAVMAVSGVVNALVSAHLLRVGRETDSPALVADGAHLRTDVLTSAVVLVGLLAVRIGAPPIWDPIAGLVVSAVIISIGLRLGSTAIDSLSDRALPQAEEQALRDVLDAHPQVMSYHRLRTRRSGSERHADVHVLVADDLTFVEAHQLAERLEDALREALPNLDPVIHIEPHDDELEHQSREHQDRSTSPARPNGADHP